MSVPPAKVPIAAPAAVDMDWDDEDEQTTVYDKAGEGDDARSLLEGNAPPHAPLPAAGMPAPSMPPGRVPAPAPPTRPINRPPMASPASISQPQPQQAAPMPQMAQQPFAPRERRSALYTADRGRRRGRARCGGSVHCALAAHRVARRDGFRAGQQAARRRRDHGERREEMRELSVHHRRPESGHVLRARARGRLSSDGGHRRRGERRRQSRAEPHPRPRARHRNQGHRRRHRAQALRRWTRSGPPAPRDQRHGAGRSSRARCRERSFRGVREARHDRSRADADHRAPEAQGVEGPRDDRARCGRRRSQGHPHQRFGSTHSAEAPDHARYPDEPVAYAGRDEARVRAVQAADQVRRRRGREDLRRGDGRLEWQRVSRAEQRRRRSTHSRRMPAPIQPPVAAVTPPSSAVKARQPAVRR